MRLPCADDIRCGDSVPAGADVADVVAAMTVSDGQAMFGATTGSVRSSSEQCSEVAAVMVTDMAPFDIVAAWCDNLPRDKKGLPPCHSCVMHDACSSYTGQLTQSGLDSWVDRVGSEFERLVGCAESKTGGHDEQVQQKE